MNQGANDLEKIMTSKLLRLTAISRLGKAVFKNGAARFELILGLFLTIVLAYGMLVSFNSIA